VNNLDRRSFGRVAALGAGIAALAACTFTSTPASATPPAAPAHDLGPVKHVDAGQLNVGYVEAGPTDGQPVILLHGWPYDIHSYADVSATLVDNGFRVIIPYLRGFGSTRFRSADTVCNGQQAARTHGVIDPLDIPSAILGGYYRWRQSLAPGETRYDTDEQRLAAKPAITVPTITIGSDFDGAAKDGAAYRGLYTGWYEHRLLDGIGHNVPQEAPHDFASAIADVHRQKGTR
jgi:pimeloyl-ACP methyl ester carboxylesterase